MPVTGVKAFDSLKSLLYPANGFLGVSFKDIVDEIGLKESVVISTLMKTVRFIRTGCEDDEGNIDVCRNELVRMEIETLDVLINEYVWEHLNTGHWKTISPEWRKLYTFASLLKAILLIMQKSDLKEVIKQCDMGLLMGQPILNNLLSKLTEDIGHSLCNIASDSNSKIFKTSRPKLIDTTVRLPNQNPASRFPIEFVDCPSVLQFADIMKRERPVVITNCIKHWPALQKWNIEYIVNVAGFRTCPVEVGSKYTAEDWTQKLMTIEEFVHKFMDPAAADSESKNFGYIAQHNLFDQISVLAHDICTPEYCSLGSTTVVDINGWFGPANTVSPTHYDPKHNLLAQVFGTKIIRLYPPTESELLCPFPSDSLLFNTSQLDIEDPNLFTTNCNLQTAKYCEFLLEPGMVLYMPPKWWHFIKSLSESFSVSFWFE